jgi:pyruvate formate-lyase activating enzyme-like uncharacterized protein
MLAFLCFYCYNERVMMRRHRITNEERVAMKLADICSDLRLDLDMVGTYLARVAPYVSYNRLQEIAESAKEEKEIQNNGRNHYTLF